MNSVKSVGGYLADLSAERQEILLPVRQCINQHIQTGFVESMTWNMPTWEVPLTTFVGTYNKKPLMYCALAAQKYHNALYLCSVYSDPRLEEMLRDGYKRAGLKLDMGKSCIRFKQLEQLPLDVIGNIISSWSVQDVIDNHERCHRK